MSEILSELVTPEVLALLKALEYFAIALYVLQVAYVIKDAHERSKYMWWVWGIVGLVPIVGLIAYQVLRPSMTLADREEQDLAVTLREHQLEHYGSCPNCGTSIEHDFVVCPNCNTQVRNVCPTCSKPLDAHWKVCPYCRTHITK